MYDELIIVRQAIMQETDMKIDDTKKEAKRFKHDIIIGAADPETGAISAQKLIRYMDHSVREKV